jgi:hypothetical protein
MRRTALHVAEIFKLPFAIPFWVVFFFAFIREGRVIRGSFTGAPSAQDEGTFRTIMIGSPLAMIAAGAASLMPWLTIPYPVVAVALGTIMLIGGESFVVTASSRLESPLQAQLSFQKTRKLFNTGYTDWFVILAIRLHA